MSTNSRRFGDYVRKWREEELRWTQLEVHEAGGPSNSTQTQIEKGALPALTNATAKKIDKGLQWEPGSAWRVWEGGDAIRRIEGRSGKDSKWLREQINSADLDEVLKRRLLKALDEGRRSG